MGLFGKSFDEKVQDAVDVINKSDLGVRDLRATVDGKVVTLEGQAANIDAKGRVMLEFNKMVTTENTINRIQVQGGPGSADAPRPGSAPAGERRSTRSSPGTRSARSPSASTGKRASTRRSSRPTGTS